MNNITTIQKYIASIDPETQKTDLLLKYNGQDISLIEKKSMSIADKINFFFRFLDPQPFSLTSVIDRLSTMEKEYQKEPENEKIIRLTKNILENKKLAKEFRLELDPNQKKQIEHLQQTFRTQNNYEFDQSMEIEEDGCTLIHLMDKIADSKTRDILELNYKIFFKLLKKIGNNYRENSCVKNYIDIISDSFVQRAKAIQAHHVDEIIEGAITNGGNSCYLNSIIQALRFVPIDPHWDITAVEYREKMKKFMTKEVLKNITQQSFETIEQELQEQGLTDKHLRRVEIVRELLSHFDARNKQIVEIVRKKLEKTNPRHSETVKKIIGETDQVLESLDFTNKEQNFSECVFVLLSSLRTLRWKEKNDEQALSVQDELTQLLQNCGFLIEDIKKAIQSAGNITATKLARDILPHEQSEKIIQDANNPDPELAKSLTRHFQFLHYQLENGKTISAREINNFRNCFIDCNFQSAGKYSQEDAQEACVKLLQALHISAELILMNLPEVSLITDFVQQRYKDKHKDELPAVLPISPVRYRFDAQTGKSKKVQKKLPLESTVIIQDKEGNKVTYQLASIIIHSGNDPKYGHYYIYAEKKGGWFELNDSQIYTKKLDSIQDNIEQNGYLFFYKKVE